MKNIPLENGAVRLCPLTEDHFVDLWPIAQQLDIHLFGPSDISTPENLKAYIATALDGAATEKSLHYAIFDKERERYIGCTRFGLIDQFNKVLHIGWTWISPDSQGTGINGQVKFLMLQYAFEVLLFEKVEFRIDERNIRSRKAVEKIGGVLEGILRENVIVKNGFRRSSCCYGILKREWLARKNTFFDS
jgi:RimJ/RimL family protein N-acetyltransferase